MYPMSEWLGARRSSFPGIPRRTIVLVSLAALSAIPGTAGAQTDYYNTDAGRPLRIEDAYPTERYAF
jgi:hypothetical protein